MHTKFKRHQKVKILHEPDPEYIEYYSDTEIPIKKGMIGKINILLPNGRYHVEIDKDGEVIAYAPFNEEDLEAID
ncbi:hypothetical protein KW805_00200 [Candidatus Pacearchaeota archaeon]|nr:hypothetical protein [Candidatus Pacearchaeota archaeon]